jgi:hypothetical protein
LPTKPSMLLSCPPYVSHAVTNSLILSLK